MYVAVLGVEGRGLDIIHAIGVNNIICSGLNNVPQGPKCDCTSISYTYYIPGVEMEA